MQKLVNCPDCGRAIPACGLKSHQNGVYCAAATNRRLAANAGYAQAGGTRQFLEKLGVFDR